MLRDYLSGECSKGDLLHFKPKHLISMRKFQIPSMGNAFYCNCFSFLPSLFREVEYLETVEFQISAFTNNYLKESFSKPYIARDLQRSEAWPSRERIDLVLACCKTC